MTTGILAFIFLIWHNKYHKCNILEIYDKNEKIELIIFLTIFVIISSIVCYLNYHLIKGKKK